MSICAPLIIYIALFGFITRVAPSICKHINGRRPNVALRDMS